MISWLCTKSVSTAWAEKTFPFNKNTAHLTSFLAGSISSHSNWFNCFMPKTNTLACHHKHFSLFGFFRPIGSFAVISGSAFFLIILFKISALRHQFQPLQCVPLLSPSGSHCQLQNLRNLLSYLFHCLPVCSHLRSLHYILLQHSLEFSHVLLILQASHLCLHTYRYDEIFSIQSRKPTNN